MSTATAMAAATAAAASPAVPQRRRRRCCEGEDAVLPDIFRLEECLVVLLAVADVLLEAPLESRGPKIKFP